MPGEHHYRVSVTWDGDRGTGTSGYRDYDRATTLRIDGKPELPASADRPFRGDPSRWNPEDLLLAAVAQCHLLSFLHAAVTLGIVVVGYEDEATGIMRQDGGNGGCFESATLHPRVVVRDEAAAALVPEAHRLAHEWCFIANSLAFPIDVEGSVEVASDAEREPGDGDTRHGQ